jgi:hypothetical protein
MKTIPAFSICGTAFTTVISDRRVSVKARLVAIGKVAERFDERQRGRVN